MYVPVPRDVEELIRQKVEDGAYESASDMVIQAVHLLAARDRSRQAELEELRREIDIGIQECERGGTEPFTEETVKRIAARGRQRLLEEAERLEAEAKALAARARQPIDESAAAE